MSVEREDASQPFGFTGGETYYAQLARIDKDIGGVRVRNSVLRRSFLKLTEQIFWPSASSHDVATDSDAYPRFQNNTRHRGYRVEHAWA